jgi:hypothetical protein
MNPPRLLALFTVLALASGAASAQTSAEGYGLELSKAATVADLEMPLYPQASAVPERRDDGNALRLGLWSPNWGFKLTVLKFRSADGMDQVVEFYRTALAAHGTVLECTRGAAPASVHAPAPAASRGGPAPLACEDDKPAPGVVVLKVGVKKDFRTVAIKPAAGGTEFDLVRLKTAGL